MSKTPTHATLNDGPVLPAQPTYAFVIDGVGYSASHSNNTWVTSIFKDGRYIGRLVFEAVEPTYSPEQTREIEAYAKAWEIGYVAGRRDLRNLLKSALGISE